MKIRFFSLFFDMTIAGCGGEPPASDLAAAKERWMQRAPLALKLPLRITPLHRAHTAALSRQSMRVEKLFKNDQSKQMIADAKAKADRAKAAAEAEKGRQRSAAEGAISAAAARSRGSRQRRWRTCGPGRERYRTVALRLKRSRCRSQCCSLCRGE